jgi:hypothetical protein
MLKHLFTTRQPADEVDLELERAMQAIHDRMERLLQAENAKHQRFSSIENVPSYYR